MNSEPRPSDREVLTGLIERVTYQNAENGFCVLRVKARGQRELITLVGHAVAISAGEWITASGSWINDRTHGQQFKARFLKTSAPTSVEGIEKNCKGHIAEQEESCSKPACSPEIPLTG